VLLLGQDVDLRRAEEWLNTEAETAVAKGEEPKMSDLSLEHLAVPVGSRHVGKPLGNLALNSLFGIQIVGIERNHRPVLSPGRSETLQPGDQLLVLGTPEQINEMAFWLST
jgi:K+/H+ antiporter YhaU regulatory subunit KhtT